MKRLWLIMITLLLECHVYTGYKESAHLFATLVGVYQGYEKENTGIRKIIYFCVGAYLFRPLCSYSIGHLCGYYLKMKNQKNDAYVESDLFESNTFDITT